MRELKQRLMAGGTSVMVAALLAMPGIASAQMVADVHFEAGNYGTMVSGTVAGKEYIDYKLGAKAGQKMFAELSLIDSNGDGTIYFNILPPGSEDVAIYNGSVDGNSTTITLPEDGTYTIRVYLMGNDEDTGKTSGFNLDLSIQ